MRDIAKTGIAKSSRNKDQGYNFRGVESAMNEMSPILIKNGIAISSTYSDFNVHERESKSGGKLRFVTLKGSFKFEAEDGSFIISEAFGEGMDSSDKATSKAQSVAFRTALFQQFVVPTMAIDPESDDVAGQAREEELQDAAMEMVRLFDEGKEVAAYEVWDGIKDNEDKIYVWGCLRPNSSLRSAIKRIQKADKQSSQLEVE